MRIRKRNNIIYWLGFSLFFVPLIFGFIYYLFKGDLFTDNYADSLSNLLSAYGDGTNDSAYNMQYFVGYFFNNALFAWCADVADFLVNEAYVENNVISGFMFYLIAWILIYNEIWLFIRVFLWFFDIPNELLERSVNVV